MRLTATDSKAKEVKAVLLDGKPVPMVVEVDTNEGWVLSAVPDIQKDNLIKSNDTVKVNEDNQNECDIKTVKRFGKVEVIFHDTTVDD